MGLKPMQSLLTSAHPLPHWDPALGSALPFPSASFVWLYSKNFARLVSG